MFIAIIFLVLPALLYCLKNCLDLGFDRPPISKALAGQIFWHSD